MKHPEESVLSVVLSIEFDGAFLSKDDWLWLFSSNATTNGEVALVEIIQNTDKFKDSLGAMAKWGVSQQLISHLKYAKDQGAKWVFFFDYPVKKEVKDGR